MAEAKAKKPNIFKRIGKFFTDLVSEMKKIVWPSKKQTLNNTLAVLVIVVVAALVIVGLDIVFAKVLELLISLLT